MSPAALRRTSALFGFLGVGLGAFGAHALKGVLERHGTADAWKTGVLYHLVHAVVLLSLSTRPAGALWAVRLFSTGIVLFSGSLYVYALTLWKGAALVTPAGGLCLLGGWVALWLLKE